jgi:hypothetical protein
MSTTSRANWAADIKALHREAAGCLELWVVLVSDAPLLVAESQSGNREALLILQGVNSALGQIKGAPADHLTLCGCCSRALNNVMFSFMVAKPANNPMSPHSLVLAICDGCGTSRETILAAGIRALQDFWPDARAIRITHSKGGRA